MYMYEHQNSIHQIILYTLDASIYLRLTVRSTARHVIHLQLDISTNAFEIRAVQSLKYIV
jgi:hypothetical protein